VAINHDCLFVRLGRRREEEERISRHPHVAPAMVDEAEGLEE